MKLKPNKYSKQASFLDLQSKKWNLLLYYAPKYINVTNKYKHLVLLTRSIDV